MDNPSKGQSAHGTPDAGLRSLNHYKTTLPPWRYNLRQRLLPLIRLETPYLAWLQEKSRSPALDSYFAITANLGTHTFFMVMLPILFWCGYPSFGKGLVHILASGVFFTGFLKDFFSLPRPLSPPLQRITMSGSAALEYGFPSTHSANAVSVAVYSILILRSPENTLSETTKLVLEGVSYFYALSIVVGRLYCGMHGFLDVIVGSVLGAAIGLIEFYYGPPLDKYMHASSWVAPVMAALVIIILVRVHPEPADDCPCFDDSVAFAGVVIGLEIGTWSYGRIPGDPFETNAHNVTSQNIASLGPVVFVARIVFGVAIVFAWREVMKPTLLRVLPHLFRLIERAGLSLPRRFFKRASEYKVVPPGSRMDTLLPSMRDLPRAVESIRNPTKRGRSVSIGPQSAADAYETLAYRERRRRESVESNGSLRSKGSMFELRGSRGGPGGVGGNSLVPDLDGNGAMASGTVHGPGAGTPGDHEKQMGTGGVLRHPVEEDSNRYPSPAEKAAEEEEMFSRLVRPRVRYDVEVVTKLVVYAGIAGLGTEVIPLLLEFVGLGSRVVA